MGRKKRSEEGRQSIEEGEEERKKEGCRVEEAEVGGKKRSK